MKNFNFILFFEKIWAFVVNITSKMRSRQMTLISRVEKMKFRMYSESRSMNSEWRHARSGNLLVSMPSSFSLLSLAFRLL